MAKYRFIGGDNREYGPYSTERMQQFIAENRVNAKTQVRRDEGPFQPAENFPELMTGSQPGVPPAQFAPGTPADTADRKPGKLQAMTIMTLVGGILAVLASLGVIAGFILGVIGSMGLGLIFCVCIVLPIYQMVAGILCIIQGVKLMGANPEQYYFKTKNTAILQIVCVIAGDVINLVLGIITLVFFKDEEVLAWVRARGGRV